MFRVYYLTKNEKQSPVFVANFDYEDFAQISVNASNELYAGEREFYLEDSAADEVTDEPEDEQESDNTCANCNGTGEGSHDGARCIVCKGTGETK